MPKNPHYIPTGNKKVKIGIFTGGTSVRSKNILTDISRYPTGKHEIKVDIVFMAKTVEINKQMMQCVGFFFNHIHSRKSRGGGSLYLGSPPKNLRPPLFSSNRRTGRTKDAPLSNIIDFFTMRHTVTEL